MLVSFVYEHKEKHPLCVSKKGCEEKHVDLLLIQEKSKRHYVVNKYFNTFMCDHTLHHGKKHFCRYCLQVFSTEEILKIHSKDCSKINGKQRIVMPKKDEHVKFKKLCHHLRFMQILKVYLCQNIMESKI